MRFFSECSRKNVRIAGMWALLILTLPAFYISAHYFPPQDAYQVLPWPRSEIILSHIPAVTWLLLMISWIWGWKHILKIKFSRPVLSIGLGFAALFFVSFSILYDYAPLILGDSASNAGFTASLAKGNIPYVPWTALDYGKQTFPFYILSPLFFFFGLWPRLPQFILALIAIITAGSFYLLLMELKIHRMIAFLLSVSVAIHPHLVSCQIGFLPRMHSSAIFILLPTLLLMRSIRSLLEENSKSLLFQLALMGMFVGIGFNVYDTNYVTGAVTSVLLAGCLCFYSLFLKKFPIRSLVQSILFYGFSVLVGTGPLLIYAIHYPGILTTRLRGSNISMDLMSSLKYLAVIHFKPDVYFQWIPFWCIYLIVPGIVIFSLQKPRVLRSAILAQIFLLLCLFVASSYEGQRRVIALVCFEYMLMGVFLDYVLNRFLKTRYLSKTASVVVALILLLSAGMNARSSYFHKTKEYLATQTNSMKIFKRYNDLIKEHASIKNLYIFEPDIGPYGRYWSGGNTQIYNLTFPNILTHTNYERKLRLIIEDMIEKDEPFVFVFLLRDEYPTSLTHFVDKTTRKARYEKISRIENQLRDLLSEQHVSDIQLTEIADESNKFLAHAYIRK